MCGLLLWGEGGKRRTQVGAWDGWVWELQTLASQGRECLRGPWEGVVKLGSNTRAVGLRRAGAQLAPGQPSPALTTALAGLISAGGPFVPEEKCRSVLHPPGPENDLCTKLDGMYRSKHDLGLGLIHLKGLRARALVRQSPQCQSSEQPRGRPGS